MKLRNDLKPCQRKHAFKSDRESYLPDWNYVFDDFLRIINQFLCQRMSIILSSNVRDGTRQEPIGKWCVSTYSTLWDCWGCFGEPQHKGMYEIMEDGSKIGDRRRKDAYSVTGSTAWECSHVVFLFHLWTWVAAALAWAMGEQAGAEGEHGHSRR
jgi:hypothetical protein